jgi:hypothetical protein
MGTILLVTLLLTLAGVVLARSRPQPESKLARSLTFGELTPVPFVQAEAASTTAPWFRITFDKTPTDGTVPALPVTQPAQSSEESEETVPGTVQNLRRAE